MHRILPLLMAAFLSSCCVARPEGEPPEVVADDATVVVWILNASADGRAEASLSVKNNSGYTHIVQELFLESGEVLVEAFAIRGYVRDVHRWEAITHNRRMVLYAASVCGMDATSSGWGELPDNGLGLETTTNPDRFNPYYKAGGHKRAGTIVKRSGTTTEWWISDSGKIVTAGGDAKWTR